jgi:hypothetical protein
MNDGNSTQTFNVAFAGRRATHTLREGAVATYVW